MRRQLVSLTVIAVLFVGGAILLRHLLNPPTVTVGLLVSEEPLFGSPLLISASQFYVDSHNEARREPRLRLVVASYRHSALQAAKALRDQRAQVLLGALRPQLADKASEAAEELQIPLVSPTEPPGAAENRPFAFFLRQPLETAAPQVVTFLRQFGTPRVVAFSSVDDVRYGQGLIEDIEKEGFPVERDLVGADGTFALTGESRERPEPQAVLVLAPPEVSYWICRQVRSLWPGTVLILSPWSLSGDLTLFDEARDLEFLFIEAFDPWSADDPTLLPLYGDAYGRTVAGAFRHVALAMEFIVHGTVSDPSLQGGALRGALSETFTAGKEEGFPLSLRLFRHRRKEAAEAVGGP